MFRIKKNDGYLCVLHGAVAVDRAVGGVLYALDRDQDALIEQAQLDLPPAMAAFAHTLAPGDGSATGNAATARHRVVIRDVASDYAGERKDEALAAGIGAVTATPLIDSRFRVAGVLTLYYRQPHHPSYRAAQQLDACCKVAGQLLEVFALQEQLSDRYSTAAIRQQLMSPAARQAVDAVSTLLPSCRRGKADETVYLSLARHLDLIIRELSAA